MLKLKWASTSEQETISSSPTQKFGCLPRNLKTGAGLSAAPARQLHLDTTLHGNAQDKPRKTGWADVINGGGARKWSMLTRCSKEIPLSKAAQDTGFLESYLSRDNRSHEHPRPLTQLRTKQLKLPLLLGGNGYNSLKISPMMTSSLCNKKSEVDKKLQEFDIQSKLIWQLHGMIPKNYYKRSLTHTGGAWCVFKKIKKQSPKMNLLLQF